jgi:hypothetical protein
MRLVIGRPTLEQVDIETCQKEIANSGLIE